MFLYSLSNKNPTISFSLFIPEWGCFSDFYEKRYFISLCFPTAGNSVKLFIDSVDPWVKNENLAQGLKESLRGKAEDGTGQTQALQLDVPPRSSSGCHLAPFMAPTMSTAMCTSKAVSSALDEDACSVFRWDGNRILQMVHTSVSNVPGDSETSCCIVRPRLPGAAKPQKELFPNGQSVHRNWCRPPKWERVARTWVWDDWFVFSFQLAWLPKESYWSLPLGFLEFQGGGQNLAPHWTCLCWHVSLYYFLLGLDSRKAFG